MPHLDKASESLITLHRRCRESRVLPEPGGLLDQDENTMQAFDVIDGAIRAHQKSERERLAAEARAKTLARTNGG